MLGIFNSLGGGEVVVILVLALIVLGPEKLPEAIRKFGNIYGELRRMSQGFQTELRDAFDEPLRELRGTAQTVQDAVQQPMTAVSSALTASTTEPAPAAPATAPVEETQAPVEETRAPVEETQAPVEDVDGPVEESTPAEGSPASADDATRDEPDEAPPAAAQEVQLDDEAPAVTSTADDVTG